MAAAKPRHRPRAEKAAGHLGASWKRNYRVGITPRHCDREHRADQAQDHDGRHDIPVLLWLVGAWQPGFGLNCGNIARRQLEPQLQDFLSRHTFHVSSGSSLGIGIVVLGNTVYVLPYEQAREECAETPLRLVLERNVGMLEIFSFDVELLKDLAQPFDRRIALTPIPATTCREAHRRSTWCLPAQSRDLRSSPATFGS